MADTHDYDTISITADELNSTHVLVGQSGGLSAVYEAEMSDAMPGCIRVETEHGPLYLDADEAITYEVLADDLRNGNDETVSTDPFEDILDSVLMAAQSRVASQVAQAIHDEVRDYIGNHYEYDDNDGIN